VGAGPDLVLFAAAETFVQACCKPAELLYSLTWGYLWKDYLLKGFFWEGYSRSDTLHIYKIV